MDRLQWSLRLADLDPVRGSEQRGRRPVLIVSNQEFNQAVPNVTVTPLTSTKRKLYPSEVLIPRGIAGQREDSILMAHQVRTISQHRLGELVGYLDDLDVRREVRLALIEHLDLA